MQMSGSDDLGLGAVSAWPPTPISYNVLAAKVRSWVATKPIQTLAEASGWEWPETDDTVVLLNSLATLSDDWDFRGRRTAENTTVIERGEMPVMPAVMRGRTISELLIRAAAQRLGMVTAETPVGQRYTHTVVLAGAVRACVNRTRYVAELIRDGLETDEIVVLGAHRALGADTAEREQASALGLGDCDSESAVVLSSARQAFNLDSPGQVEESAPDLGTEEQRLARSARYRWHGIEVVIAPSEHPDRGLRANTAAQLRYWRDQSAIGQNDRVLLVTTQIYVPYQHLVGVEVLGLHAGCGVWTCGVDADKAAVPTRGFTGTDYLQEIRSVMLAARSLLGVARAGVS